MIHFTKEGEYKKIGLNFLKAPGDIVVSWVWYTPASQELHGWRFRFRWHIKPRIIWSVERSNVIKNYLMIHDCEIVQKETLIDLRELQERQMQISRTWADSYCARNT